MSSHAKLAPSAAERWMQCPGAIRLSAGIPTTASAAAEDGTRLHGYLEKILRGGNAFEICPVEPEREMVQFCVDTIFDDYMYSGSKLKFPVYSRIEVRLNKLTTIHPHLWGTADCIGRDESAGLLRVYDAKFGKKYVNAEGNWQMLIYALGAALEYPGFKFNEVELTILQPRGKTPATKVRRWRLSAMELMVDYRAEIERAAHATDDPKAPLCAGDWCYFCPARKICPAQQEKKSARAVDVFGSHDEFESLFGGGNRE